MQWPLMGAPMGDMARGILAAVWRCENAGVTYQAA